MTTTTKDQNGNDLTRSVKKEENGWGSNVWFGGINGLGTNVRRYYYSTKKAALKSDISDEIGKDGRIG